MQDVVSTNSLPGMKTVSQILFGLAGVATAQLAQLERVPGLPSPAQLAAALAAGPPAPHLFPRVPLSTNDNVSIPLHSVQLLHPPPVPQGGSSCTVELLKYAFGDGSYDRPAVVSYSPPACAKGSTGVVGNLTVYANVRNGTQYDRLSSVYLDHVEIWRHSSAEPAKTGTVWTALKDLTPYSALLAKNGTLLMDFSNIVSKDLGLDGVFYVTLTATFYSGTLPRTEVAPAEIVLPLSNLSPDHANYFSISDSAVGGVTSLTVPINTVKAVVEVYCSGNGAEEFWYLNTPDEIVDYFSPDAGLVAKGPFREIQVLVDGKLAGVVWPFPVIYTGGITPTNWRPLTSYGAYNQPSYFVDITPFLPTLTNSKAHNITLSVVGQGLSPLHSINSNWFVSGNVRLTTGSSPVRTTGSMRSYSVDPFVSPSVKAAANDGNKTVQASISTTRRVSINSELVIGGGEKRVIIFEQDLKFENQQRYQNDGWVQWGTQLTSGYTISSSNGEISILDTFSYPLSVFSNYTLYSMQFGSYGSAINQTFTRALRPPSGRAHTILWSSKSQGWVGMDDAPGLRHAINGTGETIQSFAYGDVQKETYYRKSHAKNDWWVEDVVWGSLASRNPSVPKKDILPGGGTGFKRNLGGRLGELKTGV
ncbi:peptide-N(4)-(N-acetyl-beta-glucosaminyl)asparagine amidase A [Ceratobasidium sp. AG-Ba]|nr:peptide-N(4)-(N-acetyl-beta-glucosaminyl)asparagine amidase A [Ceratobasidium sp. AG-Ba]